MSLDAVLADIRACRACAGDFPHAPRPVVRVAAGTRLLIAGQAPGRRVHESGLPFDDASGDRLRDWMGVDRATFYGHPAIGVAAMAFCFPGTDPKGGDYPPPRRCAELWRAPLLAELKAVELTLLVGGYAQAWALGRRMKATMTETVRAWREYLDEGVLVLPHPSWRNTGWLKRNPWFEDEAAPFLRHRVAGMVAA
ncbi:uracil-DNA glycosylase family protein [Caulobacter mirabilis]|uniref:Uracil-DNA glycosylase n=1 Tax=Caulobacter mirabilis TaxID=69666 RepID=A0A2D2AWG6_9CAUL|nr:uracil-DNA glycosylase family protein [Caulobacter mirabilis]ATQ42349.1 uracil-DNA glycosylase [Caulobacter mirabilis]